MVISKDSLETKENFINESENNRFLAAKDGCVNTETKKGNLLKSSNKIEGGLRTRCKYKKYSVGIPIVTVVSVVLNDQNGIERTIKSIINQTYQNVEYIIIDGGSSDATVEIIKKYNEYIDYWVSEPDNGLYYAMNKGLLLANGKWISFMNSGDEYLDNGTIEKVFNKNRNYSVIYGDVLFCFDKNDSIYVRAKPLSGFWKGMQFVHQAAFVRRDVMCKYPFDINYRLASDYNSLYRMYLDKETFYHLDFPICSFQAGGLSDNNPNSILECQKIVFPNNKSISIRIFYYCRYIECFIKYNTAKIIGQHNYAMIRKIKNRVLNH